MKTQGKKMSRTHQYHQRENQVYKIFLKMTIMNNTKEESKKGNKRNRKELVGEPEY